MAETLTIRTASSTEVVKIAVQGPQGATGQGVPVGGSTGQVLRKASNDNYDTEWAAAGSGSGSVTSVAVSGSDGIEVDSGSPITSSGTIALGINAATLRSHINVADGAEVNVNADWNASSGDAQILNKPTLGGAAALNVGTTTGTVAAGDDARLSDSRTPTAHAASHAAGGADELFDQSLNQADDVNFNSVTAADVFGLAAVEVVGVSPNRINCHGDLGIEFFGTTAASTRTNLGLGTAAVANLGTGASDAAYGNHTHSQLHDKSHTMTDATSHTAGNWKLFYSDGAGAVQELALASTAGHVLQSNGATSPPSFAAASGGGVTGAASSASDVLGVSGSNITGVDAGSADRLVFWDDSASKLTYLEAGSGLSISGTTITATASGGSKTYAVFSAEHNQPPSTAFATLDTRNSIAVLDFDDATDESAVFVGIIPEGASLGSGLKIRLHWAATSATSGNCVWDVSLERMTTDLDSDSFDTIASATAAANGTSGILTVTEITLTTIDSVTAGDGFRLKVTRDANNGSDTMSGDAELVLVEVRSAA